MPIQDDTTRQTVLVATNGHFAPPAKPTLTERIEALKHDLPSAHLLRAWVSAMVRPFMSRFEDGSDKEQFVDAWVKRYLREINQRADGPVKLWDRNLLVVSRKTGESISP